MPSRCAAKLLNGEADLALTPVAIIPELGRAELVSDYCIGATGQVRTVCIYAQQPLETIERIYLDYHSRTSVVLAEWLCRSYWNCRAELIPAREGYEAMIGGTTAGLIIGDRAFGREKDFPYVYDLGEAWTQWTGLPFVFAAWVSRKPLDPGFTAAFNTALELGIQKIPELVNVLPALPGIDLESYFKENISYNLDAAKWEGMNRFLQHLAGEKGYELHRKNVHANIEQAL
jgi:chorismate dehydratase